jgi:hypothetical protein
MSSATLNFVLAKPNEAADRIEALEESAHRLNRKIEWWEDKYRQQVCRAEALEAALRAISREMPSDSADKLRRIARAALAPEPWPQDAIDQEMIERTDDGWSLPPAEQDK